MLTGTQFFDGDRDHLGQPLAEGENPGAVLNHLMTSANCLVVKQVVGGRLRLFVRTTKMVPPGVELLHDYNDKRPNVEGHEFLRH
jgi:hypothetical protein